MEEGALLRLDAGGRLDAKEGGLHDVVEDSLRRQDSIATFNFAVHFHRSNVALKAESDGSPLRTSSLVSQEAVCLRVLSNMGGNWL